MEWKWPVNKIATQINYFTKMSDSNKPMNGYEYDLLLRRVLLEGPNDSPRYKASPFREGLVNFFEQYASGIDIKIIDIRPPNEEHFEKERNTVNVFVRAENPASNNKLKMRISGLILRKCADHPTGLTNSK
jgi:hypothetical protein